MKTISVTFSGSGVQAYAYYVNAQRIEEWGLSDADSDGCYSTTHELQHELLGDGITCKLICHGITESPDIAVKFNRKKIQVEDLTNIDGLEPDDYDHETTLKMVYEPRFLEDLNVPNGKHLIIEVTEYDSGRLSTAFETADGKIELSDLLISAKDLDTEHDVSVATYMAGLLKDAEFDIRELQYNGQSSEFSLDISGLYSSSFYLCICDESGRWRSHEIKIFDPE